MSRVLSVATAAVAAAAVFASSASGQVYPNRAHGGWNGIPFWTVPCAYQQVFAAGQFGSAPIQIHSLAFAPDSFYNGEDFIMTNLVVQIGYTDKAPGGLSADLPSNVRGTLTQVMNSPSFHGTVDSQGPDHFSMILPFTTPFCYDPAAGNLLVQIDLAGSSLGIAVSVSGGLPDSSRAWNSTIFGNSFDTIAARMMFEITPCSSGLTLALGGACPGTINIGWSGATPSKQMGIVYARNTGSFRVPGGPCAGTSLGLGSNQLQLVNTVNTGRGSGNVNGNAGPSACGGYLQLVVVEGNPCTTSNVVRLP